MAVDFSGYATKSGVQCSDGRVIGRDAFKAQDGTKVPLVWGHEHGDPSKVLGHALLEDRDGDVYAHCSLNATEAGEHARELVKHGDLDSLSIWANQLQQNGTEVVHGVIREVSLVLSGANPEARIDAVYISHGDGFDEEAEDEAIISFGELIHADSDDSKEDASDETVQDVLDTLNEKQCQ